MQNDAFWAIHFTVSDLETAALCTDALEEICLSNSFFEDPQNGWHITFLWKADSGQKSEGDSHLATLQGALAAHPTLAALSVSEFHLEYVPPKDWLAENQKSFQPITVGPFFIYPSHYAGDLPAGHHGLKIDAATAFGSGSHPTTQGCLRALTHLHDVLGDSSPHTILDLGCGSGILAMGAAHLWPGADVWAADNDPEAVRMTQFNTEVNGLSHRIRSLVSEGMEAGPLRGQTFDLIVANILAGPLKSLAPALNKALNPGGFLVLSGLLLSQESEVLAAYQPFGFYALCLPADEWSTLVLTKPQGEAC